MFCAYKTGPNGSLYYNIVVRLVLQSIDLLMALVRVRGGGRRYRIGQRWHTTRKAMQRCRRAVSCSREQRGSIANGSRSCLLTGIAFARVPGIVEHAVYMHITWMSYYNIASQVFCASACDLVQVSALVVYSLYFVLKYMYIIYVYQRSTQTLAHLKQFEERVLPRSVLCCCSGMENQISNA